MVIQKLFGRCNYSPTTYLQVDPQTIQSKSGILILVILFGHYMVIRNVFSRYNFLPTTNWQVDLRMLRSKSGMLILVTVLGH